MVNLFIYIHILQWVGSGKQVRRLGINLALSVKRAERWPLIQREAVMVFQMVMKADRWP